MQNYNFIQKFLHDLLFSQKFINKSLFEIEKLFFLKKKLINHSQIFITGLPRSGTTSILNFIYSSGEFASLKYSNMPFILSPNISKIFNKKSFEKKERLHLDKITYDLNSPEAFDEVFLSDKIQFIKDELSNYLKLILISENKFKYVSKNNLNYKRIDLLTSLLPNSNFLIPIREPLQQCFSLSIQHKHFCNLQKKNDFIRRYMNYLGHNEFGLNHKPWNNPINFQDLNDINYWLEQWYLFYSKIYKKYQANKNCIFIIYENLSNPNYIRNILKKINLDKNNNLNLNYFKNLNKTIDISFDNEIYQKSIDIYKSINK